MSSKSPLYCLVCGDDSSSRLIKSEGAPNNNIFQCFLNVFGATWKGNEFSFCEECQSQLDHLSKLQNDFLVLEKKIRSHEKELQTKFRKSEVRFKRKKLYEKDGRCLKLRGSIIGGKLPILDSNLIVPDNFNDLEESEDDETPQELVLPPPPPPIKTEYIMVPMEEAGQNFEDEGSDNDDDHEQEIELDVLPENQPHSSKDEIVIKKEIKTPPSSPLPPLHHFVADPNSSSEEREDEKKLKRKRKGAKPSSSSSPPQKVNRTARGGKKKAPKPRRKPPPRKDGMLRSEAQFRCKCGILYATTSDKYRCPCKGPHICAECGKKFGRMDSVLRHQRKHENN